MTDMTTGMKTDSRFFSEIAVLLQTARNNTYRAINSIMVETYWQIGRRIVEQEQNGKDRADYGEKLIVNLSRYLTDVFGKGFSVANLWNFRKFYITFPEFSSQRLENLAWTHLTHIMRLDDPKDLSGKETLFETALISNLQKFLLELGKGFSFVARQLRVSTETDHFYVDLVFYNYLLKCFVIIDLKTTKLTHADIGQMDMYVRMFDELKRGKDDNPTIGIIFCTDKAETMVKYSILKENRQIFASKYKTILPTEEELAAMIAKENTKLLVDEVSVKKEIANI